MVHGEKSVIDFESRCGMEGIMMIGGLQAGVGARIVQKLDARAVDCTSKITLPEAAFGGGEVSPDWKRVIFTRGKRRRERLEDFSNLMLVILAIQ